MTRPAPPAPGGGVTGGPPLTSPWIPAGAAVSFGTSFEFGDLIPLPQDLYYLIFRPATMRLSGATLGWALLWRGLAYGIVDGLLFFAFPWIVVWRARDGERRVLRGKAGVAAGAWVATLIVTTAYHLGYEDFRSRKIVQPNVGGTIAAVPTLAMEARQIIGWPRATYPGRDPARIVRRRYSVLPQAMARRTHTRRAGA